MRRLTVRTAHSPREGVGVPPEPQCVVLPAPLRDWESDVVDARRKVVDVAYGRGRATLGASSSLTWTGARLVA